jgi:sporulation protein YlmC with PRC-barrel domain
MLHRLSRLRGCHIHAVDGVIGHVDDVLVDERTLAVQYLVVDTSNWIGGKWVAIAPSTLRAIDWGKQRIDVDLTREQIKSGPTLDSLDVPPAEAWPNYAFIF